MRSNQQLTNWLGGMSAFTGQLHTIPKTMESGLTAEMVAAQICPPDPFITADKAKAPYVLTCTLREALLVGKTLARAKARGLPLWGYMRSASHVTNGRWIKLDLDGIGKDETLALLEKLEAEKLGYLLYSTWSHGLKPRNRLRLILFLDRALPPAEYKRASQGAALWLIGQSLDPSEGGLHQLAGVFMCHPERMSKAFRLVEIGGDRHCVSAAALLALVPVQFKSPTLMTTPAPIIINGKIGDSLRWIDANDTHQWVRVGMSLKALEPELGINAFGFWLAFSESADEASKTNNSDDRYDPETMWESFTPSMPIEAAQGQLFALARDGAAALLRGEFPSGQLTQNGQDAIAYLEHRHPRFLNSLLADAGYGGQV